MMSNPRWSGSDSRSICCRIVVEGVLTLSTPAHFGNGDADEVTDMPLLVDSLTGKPMLAGASLAGAMRSYLRAREKGDRLRLPNERDDDEIFQKKKEEEMKSETVRLFGTFRSGEGEQSALVIDRDSLGETPDDRGKELREGARLDSASRTATDGGLFDLHLWPAGTTFPIRFELILRDKEDAEALKTAFATALDGFNDHGITLGARKHRGYGQLFVKEWIVKIYDLRKPEGLLAWLCADHPDWIAPPSIITGPNARELLGISEVASSFNQHQRFALRATFSLDGSLLIRSGGGRSDFAPDIVHLRSYRETEKREAPILSGTSLAGALRARSFMIAQALSDDDNKARDLVDEVFGADMKSTEGGAGGLSDAKSDSNKRPRASRLTIREAEIKRPSREDLVQNRVSIDRFTGGASEGKLFNEQPVFGNDETFIDLEMELVLPPEPTVAEAEIGLMLLLLKDLWTGDLPIGGEIGVGRGRLKGCLARMTHRISDDMKIWNLVDEEGRLSLKRERENEASEDPWLELERYVCQLRNFLSDHSSESVG